jgi:hypothetical protein
MYLYTIEKLRSRSLDLECATLLFYYLLWSNAFFRLYVMSRTDLDLLVSTSGTAILYDFLLNCFAAATDAAISL